MTRSTLGLLLGIAATWLSPGLSHAQYSVPSQAADSGRVGTARSKIKEKLVTEDDGWEVGASLNFLTAETSLGGEDLRFTDVVLLRIHGLWAVGGSVEIFAGSDILPKQPSYTDELEWQGALAGARFALGDSFAAWVRAQGGPHLGRNGWWVGGAGAVQYKLALEDVLFFESSLGLTHTQLFYDQDSDRQYWLNQIFTQFGIAIRDPKKGQFGAWLAFDYYYPLVGEPDPSDVDTGEPTALDPQPRVNFHLGGLIGLSETVDLFIEWSILDRGDLEDAQTLLPILNGGFDQKQILFGFMRRFGARERP
ncbi:MAG: hypothetical protein KJO07_10350 [Deltaproteobacteria bacterium]|nr:hypothetical protein [Deltaproteobacteria bacterium]